MATWLDVLGAISGAIGLIDVTVNHVCAIRKAYKSTDGIDDRLADLGEQCIAIKANFRQIKLSVADSSEALTEETSKQLELLARRAKSAIETTNTELEQLNGGITKSGSGPSIKRKLLRLRNTAYIAVNPDKLECAEKSLGEAIDGSTHMLILLRLDSRENRSEVFEKFHDCPEVPANVVLDFDSCDENGEPMTCEGRLLRAVLRSAGDDGVSSVSVIGGRRSQAALGMGGVGKTTALRAVCGVEEVRRKYEDGICFMEFGQDANDKKVIDELVRCVRNFKGARVVLEMLREPSLQKAVEFASTWLSAKTVLLVCDDVWSMKYVSQLKKVLSSAPKSTLAISTRDRNIAYGVGCSIEFNAVSPRGQQARDIFAKAAVGEAYKSIFDTTGCEEEVRRILDMCGGLQLALGIAGSGVRVDYEDLGGNVEEAVRHYLRRLEEDIFESGNERLPEYPGLYHIVEASLRQCEKWGRSDGREFDMCSLFKALCVLEKQGTVPISVLSRLWKVGHEDAVKILLKFADCSIVKRERVSFGGSDSGYELGARLHDLVLVLCQRMAGSEYRLEHRKLLDSYLAPEEESKDNMSGCRGWWDLADDEYMMGNLSRHLVESGNAGELEVVLCDIRWIMVRWRAGGWPALDVDFERLFRGIGDKCVARSMRRIHWTLERSWQSIEWNEGLFPFYVCGHLSRKERREEQVHRLLKSIRSYFPYPWLEPLEKCVGPKDRRERARWSFDSRVISFQMLWVNDKIVIATDFAIVVWSMGKQEQLTTIPCSATCVAVSGDGKVIVSGSEDNTVRRWNAGTGDEIGEPLHGHEGSVTCVGVSGDGKVIMSGSEDKTVRRWNTETGDEIGEPLHEHEDWVTCVAMSEDGKVIVSGSRDMTMRRWNTETGDEIGEPLRGHEDFVTCVAVSGDGKFIVSGSADKTVRRWNAETGDEIGEPLRGHTDFVMCVAVSEDGKFIVSGSHDYTVRQWNAETGYEIGEPPYGHEGWVRCVAVSEDGKVIVSGSSDKTVRRWSTNTDDEIGEPLRGHEDFVTCVAMSGDGEVVVSGSGDKTVHRWSAETGDKIGEPLRGHEDFVTCVAVSVDGKFIVSGSHDKTVRRWSTETGDEIGGPLRGHEGWVRCVAVSGDGKVIVSGSRDKTLRRWNAETGDEIGEPLRGHKGWVTCVAVSGDGKVIVSGSRDKTVRRWSAETGDEIGEPLRGHEDWVMCVAVSGDGKFIVSGSHDKTVRRWSTETGDEIGEPLRGHEDWVTCVAVSGDGKVIVSGSHDRTVRKWNADAGEELGVERCSDIHSVYEGVRLRASYNPDAKKGLVLPSETISFAINVDKGVTVLGLSNNCVAVCLLNKE